MKMPAGICLTEQLQTHHGLFDKQICLAGGGGECGVGWGGINAGHHQPTWTSHTLVVSGGDGGSSGDKNLKISMFPQLLVSLTSLQKKKRKLINSNFL